MTKIHRHRIALPAIKWYCFYKEPNKIDGRMEGLVRSDHRI
jgi:hypothetical protein